MKFDHPIPLARDLHKLLEPLGAKQRMSHEIYQHLAVAYASEGRYYHTLTHIGQILGQIDFLVSSSDYLLTSDDHLAVKLAAWFHDGVYDPRRNDNEEQSAVWMERVLTPLHLSTSLLTNSTHLILATRKHETSSNNLAAQILLDADLSILGAPTEIYTQYAAAIRQEFDFVPEEAYRAGRQAVLEQFLTRPRIYFTQMAYTVLETQARVNMKNEIHSLE